MSEEDIRKYLQREYFFDELPVPKTVNQLGALIASVIKSSPGDQHHEVMIPLRVGGYKLFRANGFINACHQKVIQFCSQKPSLPPPPNIDQSRGQGPISALTELLAWCQRASKGKAKKKPGRPGVSETIKKLDEKIAVARASGQFPRNADLAKEFDLTEYEVSKSLDRYRQRKCRERKAPEK